MKLTNSLTKPQRILLHGQHIMKLFIREEMNVAGSPSFRHVGHISVTHLSLDITTMTSQMMLKVPHT